MPRKSRRTLASINTTVERGAEEVVPLVEASADSVQRTHYVCLSSLVYFRVILSHRPPTAQEVSKTGDKTVPGVPGTGIKKCVSTFATISIRLAGLQ